MLNMKIEVACLTVISFAFGGFTTFMFVDRLILISSVSKANFLLSS